MDKNEILAKSRRENQYKDPVEQAAFQKELDSLSALYRETTGQGIIVCVLLTALHRQVLGTADFGVWAVDWAIMATVYIVRFAKLRKKSDLVLALAGVGLFLGFLWFYLHLTLGVF